MRAPLTVWRSPTGYVVHDPALETEFGCYALPLPFTPRASGDDVLAHLRRANPGREVRLSPVALDSQASGGSTPPNR